MAIAHAGGTHGSARGGVATTGQICDTVEDGEPRDARTRAEDAGAAGGACGKDALPYTFEAFFSQYEQQVFGYLVHMTGDEQTARDLSQEAFLRAWQHFDKLLTYDHPSAWLFRVATNLALSHLRRRGSPVGSAKLLGDDDSPARSDPAMRFVERDLIEQTLLELPPKQRAALVLREVYGLNCAEIGQVLSMSHDAVKMALWRARERFRVRYVRGGGRFSS
jgi:RNA polymerase sigma-70 factor (ECF subfamily)